MEITPVIAAIDAELSKLNQARKLLAGTAAAQPSATPAKKTGTRKKKRRLSAEGRERIAAAQRKRWAAQKQKHKSRER